MYWKKRNGFKMKLLILINLIYLSSYAEIKKCFDTDGGIDQSSRGKVYYEIGNQFCLKEGKNSEEAEKCYFQSFVDGDMCKNVNTLIEQYCENDIPNYKEIFCPCEKGKCLKIK